MASEQLLYRPCVGIMVLNRPGRVWIGRRHDAPGEPEGPGAWWQMPQGGIDENEDPAKAALRELAEETSIRSVEIIAETPGWYNYDLPSGLRPRAWGGRYRGQKQKWFAM
ncbi:MAG TPA: RNA pyrophosphohydrolase, partial [Aestuariivirgaceae bacterium]|nr:RNA pyrophosphohydrolase [Aestuariivirgaceae bacterium]